MTAAATAAAPDYVYVASSWRNPDQPALVEAIRAAGVGAYDFRNPAPGDRGFSWAEIDPEWESWTPEQYLEALNHPAAMRGFLLDWEAMNQADTFILILPCGRSAHLELGWAVGAGKRTCIVLNGAHEPELMAKMVDHIAVDVDDALAWLTAEVSDPWAMNAPAAPLLEMLEVDMGDGGRAATIGVSGSDEVAVLGRARAIAINAAPSWGVLSLKGRYFNDIAYDLKLIVQCEASADPRKSSHPANLAHRLRTASVSFNLGVLPRRAFEDAARILTEFSDDVAFLIPTAGPVQLSGSDAPISADSGPLPWARSTSSQCRAQREPRPDHTSGRCDLRTGHDGDHALDRGMETPRWSTDWTSEVAR